MFNPHIQGWINYYSHFYGAALCRTLRRIDAYLVRWGRNKYKRLPVPDRGGKGVVRSGRPRQPGPVCPLAPTVCRRTNIGSRMSREVQTDLGARWGAIPLRDSTPLIALLRHSSG